MALHETPHMWGDNEYPCERLLLPQHQLSRKDAVQVCSDA